MIEALATWQPLLLTFYLSAVTTSILLLICIPGGWLFLKLPDRFRTPMEAVIALPIVLPPSVLGFYLLMILSPEGPLGRLSSAFGGPALAFTFEGLVIGSVFYSLPFVMQPIVSSYSQVPQQALQLSSSLGAKPWDRFTSVVLPMSRRGILTGAILGFAHTLGEFGVVLMIGGNIPGETRVVSIAIYDHVEALEYQSAHLLSAVLLGLSLGILMLISFLNRGRSIGVRNV
ncbi:molybdate ABC transporter permease subunit [Pseudobacteriovorax antillogorgiicola]|uniref:Molybdenum transport system permease n=1 Tax=Pseudobacteriovorax antillogorgiicola TaxID=1513793 RepID=A0A1Y6CFI2_9BACT|nr:molybdate ABC transporter permease subunit [Pseudobacteriovorax antillogorgiicola]TCS49018.1 molybdate transport system permease protein [Pseudobacteriovorax antillogorgiicola]SMF52988.1 molybdate transport system permease protein [Pseudobacteriovorax antillogorgiicola]